MKADKLGVPFILVVFPDRVAVDKELREQLKVSTDQIAVLRSLYALVNQTLPDTPVLEVAEALQGRAGMYRADDTHLSDLANIIAGNYVGRRLFELLANTGVGRARSPGL
jgi:hypothetical protein